jgi:glutathione S-transferase
MNNKITMRRAAREADEYMYPWIRNLVQELIVRREGEHNHASIKEAVRALELEFSRFSPFFVKPYLAGDVPSAADYALYPLAALLKRVDAKQPSFKTGLVLSHEMLLWMTRVESLHYFSKTTPPHWRLK